MEARILSLHAVACRGPVGCDFHISSLPGQVLLRTAGGALQSECPCLPPAFQQTLCQEGFRCRRLDSRIQTRRSSNIEVCRSSFGGRPAVIVRRQGCPFCRRNFPDLPTVPSSGMYSKPQSKSLYDLRNLLYFRTFGRSGFQHPVEACRKCKDRHQRRVARRCWLQKSPAYDKCRTATSFPRTV